MNIDFKAICFGVGILLAGSNVALAYIDASGVNRCHGRGGNCGAETKATCAGVYQQDPAPNHQCEWRHGKCRKSTASCKKQASKYTAAN